jgi:hypothetical protein
MPGVIMMASLFSLFCIEMWLNAKTGGHSHGGPTGDDLTNYTVHPRGPASYAGRVARADQPRFKEKAQAL